ncbi:SRPBCC family protein [Phenylobacterium sp.]|jgi:uncharacterized protein YndB with AHSA1/START domain|uniref:SRPBCC family protein n=1 Tax=Phenylobacterium sp. TaxID=1871053 RepID=UPI002E33F133|nr:SRPBCC family protein [Phenylobacterium sp.]HEX2560740.1 SRPBCC family protein [Phenylobacterium sp.]
MIELDPRMGEARTDGEGVTLVFRRRYAKPLAKVWAAVTDAERLSAWFTPTTIERLEVGGRMEIYFPLLKQDSTATIVTLEPMRAFAWAWHEADYDTLVRFDLAPDGDGCRLTLTHSGLRPEDGPETLGGWHAYLEALEAALEGLASPRDFLARWKAALPLYGAEPGATTLNAGVRL